MPWGMSSMDAKREFIRLVTNDVRNFSAICRRFGISRTTGYELVRRFAQAGEDGLRNQSRRPHTFARQTDAETERRILAIRDETHWGARKISHVLLRDYEQAVHRTTVHSILVRNGRIDTNESLKHQAFTRFEHPRPNDLWQIDFKGDILIASERCYPFTAIDDHSRFALAIEACSDQTTETVMRVATKAFRRYGLPWRMTMDNGAPWGDDASFRLTKVTAWFIRLGIRVSHSRPRHPQTQGKDERLHGSMQRELLKWVSFASFAEAQKSFDRWRNRYNLERPHEALGMKTPAERYVVSSREMPTRLPPLVYNHADQVRTVAETGRISFHGYHIRVGKGCAGLQIAIRETNTDAVYDIVYCAQTIARIDLRTADKNRIISTVKPANAPHSPMDGSERESSVSSPEGPQRSGGGEALKKRPTDAL